MSSPQSSVAVDGVASVARILSVSEVKAEASRARGSARQAAPLRAKLIAASAVLPLAAVAVRIAALSDLAPQRGDGGGVGDGGSGPAWMKSSKLIASGALRPEKRRRGLRRTHWSASRWTPSPAVLRARAAMSAETSSQVPVPGRHGAAVPFVERAAPPAPRGEHRPVSQRRPAVDP